MFGGILIVILSGFFSFWLIDVLKAKHPLIDASFLKKLFFYHLLLSLAYFGYVMFNNSDSKFYYEKVLINYRGETWLDFYGTSTTFIEFFGYPFIRYLGFSYEAMMALFSLFGFLGFVYFFIFFRENIRFNHTFWNIDLLKLIFFLPNLHFWSASFGKGSIIFLGIGLFFFGISKMKSRIPAIILGGLIIYHVRPHIMLVILVSGAIGFMFSTKGISLASRVVFLMGATIAFFYIYQDVLSLVGVSEEEFISQGLDVSHRATELSKATSGVNIASYSMPLQVFTFLFRPLFIDAPGLLGIFVSFENVFYILITLRFFSTFQSIRYLFSGNFLIKTAFISFITISIALAQVSGNLGLAIRQKSQVMILLMFVIISFLDAEKIKSWRIQQIKKQRLRRMQANKSMIS